MVLAQGPEIAVTSVHGPHWSASRASPRSGTLAEAPHDAAAEKHAPGEKAASKATCPSAPKQSTLSPSPPAPGRKTARKTAHATSGIFRKRFSALPLFPRDSQSNQPFRVVPWMQLTAAGFCRPLR